MNNDTLKIDEIHPSTQYAYEYVKNILNSRPGLIESIYSMALSGHRTCEICAGTINRLRNNEPVSDRYLMGLALFLMNIVDTLREIQSDPT